ncbi:MAG: ABC transporter permease, partial [Acidimicrobiales bacterium]
SFIKAMVFAVTVTLVHCYYGMRATGGPAGVGVAAGRAIRLSIILIVLLDLLLSLVMFGGSSATARLVG